MVGELHFLAPTSPQGHIVGFPLCYLRTPIVSQRDPRHPAHHQSLYLGDINLTGFTFIYFSFIWYCVVQPLPWTLSLCIITLMILFYTLFPWFKLDLGLSLVRDLPRLYFQFSCLSYIFLSLYGSYFCAHTLYIH
jgi:hypothetical protein